MKLRLPKSGERVAILSPSSAIDAAADYPDVVFNCLMFGWEPELMPHLNEREGFLAGPDEHRAMDLNESLWNPDLRGIFAVRGGYGAMRILDRVDWSRLERDPKPLLGFSDITALHLACFRRGVPSLHGPHIGSRQSEFSMEGWRLAFSSSPVGELGSLEPSVRLHQGSARGKLIGGNLAVLTSLVGTLWLPTLRGCILCIEDVNEAPYRVDRMLSQLLMAGVLEGVAGIAFGRFSSPGDEVEAKMIDVLAERTHGLGAPVVANLQFGHVRDNATIPFGVMGEITGDGKLVVLESPFEG